MVILITGASHTGKTLLAQRMLERETIELTWVRRIQNRVSCVSNVLCTLIHGFFGNIQYAAIAPNIFTIKLSNQRCLECSTCAIFLSSSLTVSMIALLLNNNLSETLINAPFILLFSLVMSCIRWDGRLFSLFSVYFAVIFTVVRLKSGVYCLTYW